MQNIMRNIMLYDTSHLYEEISNGESLMTISEMIELLQKVQSKYGSDLMIGIFHRDSGGNFGSFGETFMLVDDENKLVLL